MSDYRLDLSFDDNRLLPLLYGEHDGNLGRIEQQLQIQIVSRGNVLSLAGQRDQVEQARAVLEALWQRLRGGMPVAAGDVDAAIRLSASNALAPIARADGGVKIKRRTVTPRSPTQIAYVEAMQKNSLVFGLGPAGTGKTYLAVAQAVSLLVAGQVDRIILSRPAVEAGERLGFLPGDLKEKVDPYLRPLYDALYDMLPADQVVKRLTNGEIEIAPLAFMRGRTLAHAFIILDEAQNTTPMQMKMALTRIGEGSRMVVTGDISQIDLPTGTKSGLAEAMEILAGVEGIDFIRFTNQDVMRHPLVGRIVRAYDEKGRG